MRRVLRVKRTGRLLVRLPPNISPHVSLALPHFAGLSSPRMPNVLAAVFYHSPARVDSPCWGPVLGRRAINSRNSTQYIG
jgi:hypothetical protein